MKPHQRKYYGCLVMIFCMIVGTLLLFASETENDLVGMGYSVEEIDDYIVMSYGLSGQMPVEGDWIVFDQKSTYAINPQIFRYNEEKGVWESLSFPGSYPDGLSDDDFNAYISSFEGQGITTGDYAESISNRILEEWPSSHDGSSPSTTSSRSYEETEIIYLPISKDISVPDNYVEETTLDDATLYIYSSPTTVKIKNQEKDGQVFIVKDGKVNSYNFVKDAEGVLYLATKEQGETLLIDVYSGEMYKQTEEGLVAYNGGTVVTDKIRTEILYGSEEVTNVIESVSLDKTIMTKEYEEKIAKQQASEEDLQELASTLSRDMGREVTIEELKEEQEVVDSYLENINGETKYSPYVDMKYDIVTDTYAGDLLMEDSRISTGEYHTYHYSWDSEGRMHIITPEGIEYYKETEKGKTTYYKVVDEKVVRQTGDDATKARKEYKAGEDEYEDMVEKVKKARQADCADGDYTCLPSSLREQAYMNRIYNEQEQQVKGRITGWLNNAIDKALGGWSRGVPAGICKYIFGLEYYKNEGFVSIPGNTSAEQLQSTLIANSRTVMIEGEKEEITENLYRYAYTLRLLANTGMEWQTYLSNSCTGVTSMDIFYDYGSLSAAEYYSFHYAGAGSQDMTFDCTIEECLFDQACVQVSDEPEPICVSLVHGAGFETPVAGQDYDCAIEGE